MNKSDNDDELKVSTLKTPDGLDAFQRNVLTKLAAIQQKLDRIERLVQHPSEEEPAMYDRDDHEHANE